MPYRAESVTGSGRLGDAKHADGTPLLRSAPEPKLNRCSDANVCRSRMKTMSEWKITAAAASALADALRETTRSEMTSFRGALVAGCQRSAGSPFYSRRTFCRENGLARLP
jgi:hypothetical protein